ncbi:MAG: HAMP domain-containing sensor histidine kinase [Bdellovibrionales bacterium]|jgi:signal transduction histidine kinase|nr:HAMP domain-containing sensor histidine kinase [Bdellovibrionales bacterium]
MTGITMQKTKKGILSKSLKALGLALMFVLIPLAALTLSFFATVKNSKEAIDRYVSVWEEEVAKNLLLKGDTELFEKIKYQITDIAPSSVLADSLAHKPNTASPQKRWWSTCTTSYLTQIRPITLYGTPAGQLQVCHLPIKLLANSLKSPVFAFSLLFGMMTVGLFMRRSWKYETNAALYELAVQVAHDIRAPVQALRMAANSLSNAHIQSHRNHDHDKNTAQNAVHQTREAQSLILSASNRISRIADDLLTHRRNQLRTPASATVEQNASGATQPPAHRQSDPPLRPDRQPTSSDIDIKQLSLREGLLSLSKETKLRAQSNLDIKVSIETDAPMPTDLDRVVSNILQNAVEATAACRHPVITLRTFETSEALTLCIRDNGVGIPSNILDRIKNTHESLSHGKKDGNGVGLTHARQWTHNRGGRFTIDSRPGFGTEIKITLPR